MSTAAAELEPAPILACTVSRDVQNFDLLIEDMEAECGENWGDLGFADTAAYLRQPDAETLEFIAIAIDQEDEGELATIIDIIREAKSLDIRAIVIAEDVSPIALHQLLKSGAEEFVPYPLPDGALHDAVERMRDKALRAVEPVEPRAKKSSGGDRNGVILPVHGLAGGTGSTTFAVNLAWELANIDEDDIKVCLLDLDFQFGSASTYLDLPRREAVFEMLQDVASMDHDVFMQALSTYNDRMHVLTAPAELIPLDILTNEDMEKLLEMARTSFDYVVVDMPSAVVSWTETALHAAHVYFAMTELDMRSAQNTLRMVRALKGEELPYEKLRYVLNRAPGFTDLSGKSRVKRMAESLDIKIELLMPDGGKQVVQSNDHGTPLSETATKNPLRKEIQKLAESIHETNVSVAEAD